MIDNNSFKIFHWVQDVNRNRYINHIGVGEIDLLKKSKEVLRFWSFQDIPCKILIFLESILCLKILVYTFYLKISCKKVFKSYIIPH
jgi:hypothetical protein